MKPENVSGVRLGADPVVVSTTRTDRVRRHQIALAPRGPGDDLVNVQALPHGVPAGDARYLLGGLAAVPVPCEDSGHHVSALLAFPCPLGGEGAEAGAALRSLAASEGGVTGEGHASAQFGLLLR